MSHKFKIGDVEKIEECIPELKYQIGDRVIFYFTENEIMIGHIDHTRNYPWYNIVCGDSYFQIHEKYIITQSEIEISKPKTHKPTQEKFKEGADIWIKAKILWDNFGGLGDTYICVNTGADEETCIKIKFIIEKNLCHSIPPKNDWISVKNRLPVYNQEVMFVYSNEDKKLSVHIGYYNISSLWVLRRNNEDSEESSVFSAALQCRITHWKPLDAPPTE